MNHVLRQAQGTHKGKLRPYGEAKRLGVIDAGVRELVDAMNARGLMPRSSCEGHGCLQMYALPYVVFKSDVERASGLNQALAHDAISECPRLHYFWEIQGVFNDTGDLLFRLTPGCKPGGLWWTVKKNLRNDFSTLTHAILYANLQEADA